MYRVPSEFQFRLHHIRPRFKSDIENVLIFMATEIVKIGIEPSYEFKERINQAIRMFPGNSIKKNKTINNWRTEISALFGFIVKDGHGNIVPGLRAVELADKQDLVEGFKKFLYFFQYPGGHLKNNENIKLIKEGIRFQPAKFILELLSYAEKTEGKRIGINKAEVTYCIFEDLRCTRDNEDVSNTWLRIKKNRETSQKYNWNGDVIRYAGDILEYMEIANLLVSHGPDFYINNLENSAILKFCLQPIFFKKYDEMISTREADTKDLRKIQYDWFKYVNQSIEEDFFKTDILALMADNAEEYEELKKDALESFENSIAGKTDIRTKDIGDWGESLVYGHECMRVTIGGCGDLKHLIKRIPTQFAVGYDIQSVELDSTKRLIEVKTTISNKPIQFTKFHLTPNEWSSAASYGERYYVYRLYISKHSKKLFVLVDPVGLYKKDKLQMVPRNGADITFSPNTCGQYEELLEWKT